METMQETILRVRKNTCKKKKAMEKKMIRTSFRTTLFRNHRCTKKQNENKGNNNSNQDRVTRYNDSTGISRCDFSQKCAENKGIHVRTKRDKCVSAT